MFNTIEEVLEDLRNGKMVVVMDDEGRENEGDLIIPADFASQEAVNFMAKHGRGLICLALNAERVKELGLPLMSSMNKSRHQTAFTVSIESKEGISTGISAAALYVSALIHGEKRTQREVADVAGVTEVTIRNRYKELLDRLNLEKDIKKTKKKGRR